MRDIVIHLTSGGQCPAKVNDSQLERLLGMLKCPAGMGAELLELNGEDVPAEVAAEFLRASAIERVTVAKALPAAKETAPKAGRR